MFDIFRGHKSNAVTSKRGRRFGLQEKRKFALVVYHHSPKVYRFLSSLFILASVSILHSWLRYFLLIVAWSKLTLSVLKGKAEVMSKEETLCGIVFEAMSIKEYLHIDEHGKSLKSANHAFFFSHDYRGGKKMENCFRLFLTQNLNMQ